MPRGDGSSMAEPRIVVPAVGGSSPLRHPRFPFAMPVWIAIFEMKRSAPASVAYVTTRFDARTERSIVDLWLALAEEGIELTGLSGHRPHITIGAYETDDVAAYCAVLEKFADARDAFLIRFTAIGIFPQYGVAFLAPVVTDALLALHRGVQASVGELGRPPYHDTLLPDAWTPHCTIVNGADPGTIAQITAYCSRNWRPIEGWVEGLGILTPPDTKDVFGVTFAGDRG